MQAEHPRGNGFIISPMKAPSALSKPRRSFHFPSIDTSFIDNIRQSVSRFFSLWCKGFAVSTKVFLSKCLYAGVAMCCVMVFSQHFTIGTAIYHGGKQIATVPDGKSFSAAISAAQAYAEECGISGLDISFNTAVTLSLQSNIIEGEPLKNSILLCTPYFENACTLYSGNTAIFTAENTDTAKKVSQEFLDRYSMNGKADFSSEITFKECVVPKEQIMTTEECIERLENNNLISVVSVVSSTLNKEIPYEIQSQQDENMYIGESIIVTEGKVGSRSVSYEKTYKNGEEAASRIVNESVVTQPVAAVVRVGTKHKEVLKTGVLYPLDGVLSSPFGERWGRVHEGIDIAVSEGTPVLAAECGTVCYVSENAGGYGKLVKIDHGYGVITAYAHLSEIQVQVGQSVNAQSQIALSGNTGRSTGPHLHFEILNNDVPLNPLDYLRKR